MSDRRSRSGARWLGTIGLLVALTPNLVLAQGAGAVSGRVVDSAGKRPVRDAEIMTAGAVIARTDSAGRFRVLLAPGVHDLAARAIGFQPAGKTVRVLEAETTELTLEVVGAQRLPTLTAEGARPALGGLAGFASRRAGEIGAFLDDEVFRKQEHRPLSGIMKEHAAGVRFIHYEHETIAVGRGGCAMAIWVDGLRVYAGEAQKLSANSVGRLRPNSGLSTGGAADDGPPNIDKWRAEEITAMEIYVGPGRTPIQYQMTGSACGTILIWTRMGRP
ncbi:MAG: carboxypeptidase-like regulatory domain-containing protein [Gemmatimonadales bacterium]